MAAASVSARSETSLPEAAVLYAERLATLRATERRLHRQHLQLGWLRLLLGVAILVLLWPPRVWAAAAFALFLAAGVIHSGVLRRLAAARRTVAFLEHAEARVEGRWQGRRRWPVPAAAEGSLYASDLDLFGDDSLFELLCEARTSEGAGTLARWLLAPALPAAIRQRQAAVLELRERTGLREAVAAVPGPPLAVLDLPALQLWAESPARPLPGVLQWVAPLLVLLTVAAAVRYAMTHSPVLLVAALLVEATVTFALQRATRALFGEAEQASRSLGTAAGVLALFAGESFSAPLLLELQERLRGGGAALRSLARMSRWAETSQNMFLRVVGVPVLLQVQLALALQRWQARYGPQLGGWLQAMGEIEALLSLAAFQMEHPGYCLPEMVEGAARFEAVELGHPLLPAAACVRNDVRLDPAARLLLISGSNMSGKSTLLRSVGVNAVLAYAGGAVCARSLRLAPMTLAASIHVNDSLQEGQSRFYAEILRLRSILETARMEPPVLFLIDEVLAGTNSRDRLAGARGILRELLRRGALGLMTTHDLALTSMGASEKDAIRNHHFEDQVVDGRVIFDFVLREGVLQRSNGAALMRMIGIEV